MLSLKLPLELVNRLMWTNIDALPTILAESGNRIRYIMRFLLLPELPGTYQDGLTDSLFTALWMAFLAVYRYPLLLQVNQLELFLG